MGISGEPMLKEKAREKKWKSGPPYPTCPQTKTGQFVPFAEMNMIYLLFADLSLLEVDKCFFVPGISANGCNAFCLFGCFVCGP